MTTLAAAAYRLRRHAVPRLGLLAAVACWPVLGLGLLSGAVARPGAPAFAVLVVLGLALGHAIVRELDARARTGLGHELELGLLLLTATYALLAATGGTQSFLHPLAYACMSFLVVVHRRKAAAAVWLAVAFGLELLLAVGEGFRHGHAPVGLHLLYLGFFAAGNALVLSTLVRRLRSRHADQVHEELERMHQEARDFRLIASQLPLSSRTRSREEEEMRMAQGAVEGIHEQMFHHLDLLRTALGLHTAVVLWCEEREPGAADPRGTPRLVLKEVSSATDLVAERSSIDSPGLLAAVLRDPKPLRLRALAGRRIPPYYDAPAPITDLCVVPLLDGARLRGLLCGDRCDDRAFSDDEERILGRAGEQILHLIEHERVFAAVERGKYEQEQFYRASELLNQALTLEDVYGKSFTALRAIATYDLGVITAYDARNGTHVVLASDGEPEARDGWGELRERLENLVFEDGQGLVAMAVKNRHYMPATGELADPETVVFTARTRVRQARSVLVLPLVRGEQVLGAITLAAARPQVFHAAAREMLRVISHQVAVSLQNARMYQSMEERATTDGLTGLTNHRAFQERLNLLHALAERSKQKFSLILTDIDHFKSINDTYGHPVGDVVLKRVASLLAGRARKADIVARYGGEEFVLVLPDTDAVGAEHFANKLREEIAAQTMTSEHGNFKVTISMGIAEYPADARDRHELIERADQALYWCKEHGRNRTRRAGA